MKHLIIAGKVVIVSVICSIIGSCQSVENMDYVNPFTGAAEYGHCMPCATFPMGMIQAGPQSGNCTWDYTSGYQYADTVIYGFSQTRLNGTGCPDLGDLLMMPFSGDIEPGIECSSFQKDLEVATPGYYSVNLDRSNIDVEVTASARVAMYQYKFNNQESGKRLLVDFQNGITGDSIAFYHHVKMCEQHFVSPTRIEGYARTRIWVNRTYYYVIEFSEPMTDTTYLQARHKGELAPRVVLDFDNPNSHELGVKIAISATSIEGARKNLEAEVADWDFNRVKCAARDEWRKYINGVDIEGSDAQKRIFYSALYRLYVHPNNISDVGSKPHYSTLSLWDTYRAAHPLYTILIPNKVDDFVNSMLAQYDDQGFLPIWSLWGIENYCMIGNHAVPVIVDAYLKGFRGFDPEKAWEAIDRSLRADLRRTPMSIYDRYGYFPFDLVKNESVSRTLECSFDDYCASMMAASLGKDDAAAFYASRSMSYVELFDTESGLMRAKDTKGNWRTPFDKFVISHDSTSGGDYTEGNAWQYSWHVQQSPEHLVELMGGREHFVAKLDSLFTIEQASNNSGFSKDVTGLIGQYAHGNEPSHHVAYLYKLVGEGRKSDKLLHEIFTTKYLDRVDGLCGNDDCGQMSAWYIFTAMGFYPVNPTSGEYVLGAPQLEKITINLVGNKTFTIRSVGYGDDNIYVDHVELNGQPYDSLTISHQDIMQGGELTFYMTN